MATEPPRGASTDAPSPSKSRDADQRETWFVATPDPWKEIVGLEHGGDRTFASVIERIVLSAEPAQQIGLEKKLLAVLAQPNLRPAGQLFVCRMLGLIGSASAVPAVTPLLKRNETADLARLALDGIAERSVDEAYRGALADLTGAAKAGLIGSIALRGDRLSLDALRVIAGNAQEPSDVRVAAARAIGRLSANT